MSPSRVRSMFVSDSAGVEKSGSSNSWATAGARLKPSRKLWDSAAGSGIAPAADFTSPYRIMGSCPVGALCPLKARKRFAYSAKLFGHGPCVACCCKARKASSAKTTPRTGSCSFGSIVTIDAELLAAALPRCRTNNRCTCHVVTPSFNCSGNFVTSAAASKASTTISAVA